MTDVDPNAAPEQQATPAVWPAGVMNVVLFATPGPPDSWQQWWGSTQGDMRPDLGRASGATAGVPGAWTPTGAMPPESPAKLIASDPVPVTASPATNWTVGQYVQTGTAGTAGRAYWNGTAWVAGTHP